MSDNLSGGGGEQTAGSEWIRGGGIRQDLDLERHGSEGYFGPEAFEGIQRGRIRHPASNQTITSMGLK